MITLPGTSLSARNIFCIGRSYAEHAKELKNEVPAEPVVFLKPTSALIGHGESIVIPPQSREVAYEGEIVLVIGRRLRRASEREAAQAVIGIAPGIDVTARDLQRAAQEKKLPWSIAKGFDTFAALGPVVSPDEIAEGRPLDLKLWLNGELRQSATTEQMQFSIPRILAFLSSIYTLDRGDLVFTGTPSGVGTLSPGDRVTVEIAGGRSRLEVGVVNAR